MRDHNDEAVEMCEETMAAFQRRRRALVDKDLVEPTVTLVAVQPSEALRASC